MGGPDVRRGYKRPTSIVPEVGQGSEYNAEPSSTNEAWNILQEDVRRSHLANDPRDVRPDPPLVGGAASFPGVGPGLAGKPGVDDIHASTPSSAVEGGKVVPDRSRIHGRVFHPCHDNGCRVCVEFAKTDGPVLGDRELAGEVESPDPGAEREPVDGTNSHTQCPRRAGGSRSFAVLRMAGCIGGIG